MAKRAKRVVRASATDVVAVCILVAIVVSARYAIIFIVSVNRFLEVGKRLNFWSSGS